MWHTLGGYVFFATNLLTFFHISAIRISPLISISYRIYDNFYIPRRWHVSCFLYVVIKSVRYKDRMNPLTKPFSNRRKEPRHACEGQIFFSYKKYLHAGELKNCSASGLFINSENFFLIGKKITVALPKFKYTEKYQYGRIVWKNAEGFGVQLINK